MLETLTRWIAAGDQAVLTMGPVVATALAMLGASGLTQMLKFPVARALPEAAATYAIRWLAIVTTWAMLHFLAPLPFVLEVILALAQPYAYTAVMRLIRHRWPWLEATRLAGSAQPSEAATEALLQRRDRAT